MSDKNSTQEKVQRTAGRGWLLALAVLTLVGLATCIYLSILHWQVRYLPGHTSFCAVSEEVNCDTVAMSAYSMVASVPISTWGIVFFSAMLVLIAWGWFSRRPPWPWVLLGAMNTAAVGVTAFLFLACELIIQSFCIMCLVLYAVNMLGALMCIMGQRRVGLPPSTAASLPLLGVILGSALFLFLEPHTLAEGWVGLAFIGGVTTLALVLLNLRRAGENLSQWLLGLRHNLNRLFLRPAVGYIMVALALSSLVVAFLVTQSLYPSTATTIAGGVEGLGYGKTAEGHHWLGAQEPEVTLFEYSDYQCPFCVKAHEHVRELVRRNKSWLRLVHVHMPLDKSCNPKLSRPFHRTACVSARATICAAEQDAFWSMNDRLFLRRGGLDTRGLTVLADSMGLDVVAFRKCMNSESSLRKLAADLAETRRLGLKTATPTFRIGQNVFVGIKGLDQKVNQARSR